MEEIHNLKPENLDALELTKRILLYSVSCREDFDLEEEEEEEEKDSNPTFSSTPKRNSDFRQKIHDMQLLYKISSLLQVHFSVYVIARQLYLRYSISNSVTSPKISTIPTCIFLASKIAEFPLNCDKIHNCIEYLDKIQLYNHKDPFFPNSTILLKDLVLYQLRKKLLAEEYKLLVQINFKSYYNLAHPYLLPVLQCFLPVNHPRFRDFFQRSWGYINDCYSTYAPITCSTCSIVFASLYLSFRHFGVDIFSSSDFSWLSSECDPVQVEVVVRCLVGLYKSLN